MFEYLKIKFSSLFRAHLCTLTVALSINVSARLPRDVFQYGAITYLVIYTLFIIIIGLPVTLLQLVIGQISQHDAVGVWRSVPFFKGIGYLKLLTGFIQASNIVIYTSIAGGYFMYIIGVTTPFRICEENHMLEDGVTVYIPINASSCINETFMAPVKSAPNFYGFIAIIIVTMWFISPFLLYNPVKCMKTFYAFGPIILVLSIVVVSSIGEITNLLQLFSGYEWNYYLQPYVWYAALTQSLLSAQIGNGFHISAANSIYSSTNVLWTSVSIIAANVIAAWIGILFWFSIFDDVGLDLTVFTVFVQIHQVAQTKDLNIIWPIITYIIIFLSGIVSMITCIYAIYERLKNCNGEKWHRLTAIVTIIGTAWTLSVFTGRQTALTIIEQIVVPMLVIYCTGLEVAALVYIYGWELLQQDIEFLTGDKLSVHWFIVYCGIPIMMAVFFIWWIVAIMFTSIEWSMVSTPLWTVLAFILICGVVIALAVYTIVKQLDYGIISKIKSSFKSSRNWGPRDPIARYYWLARREDNQCHIEFGSLSSNMRRYSDWQYAHFSNIQTSEFNKPLESKSSNEVMNHISDL